MTTIIPNSFQHPNVFVDELSYYLTAEEEKVLNKASREILGWHTKIESRKAAISLSVFVDGKKDDQGNVLCLGCGLGTTAVRKALDALDKYRVLIKVGQATQAGQTYWLQDDIKQIDWDGLKARKEGKTEINKGRVQVALVKKGQNGRTFSPPPPPEPEPPRTENDPIAILLTAFCDTYGMPMPESRIKIENWCADLEEIYRMSGSDVTQAVDLLKQTQPKIPERYTIVGPASIIEPCRVSLGQIKRQQQKGDQNGNGAISKQQIAQQQLANW